MRITAFDDLYPLQIATGATLLASADGSNSIDDYPRGHAHLWFVKNLGDLA